MTKPEWWTPPWPVGSEQDPDGWRAESAEDSSSASAWHEVDSSFQTEEVVRERLDSTFGQVRSRDRVRELAEVFTHQREVDAILDLMPDAFAALDIKFLEPTCGSGNFLVEILRRKLRLVRKQECSSQEQYEHQLLRAAASIYGVDISPENVTEARSRMAHVLLDHYQADANTIQPTAAFLEAAGVILGSNVVVGDTLSAADEIEMCDWHPRSGGCFVRVWSNPLVPPTKRGLFWTERIQDQEPVHYSELAAEHVASSTVVEGKRA